MLQAMFLFALWSVGLNLNDDVDQSISAVSVIRSCILSDSCLNYLRN